MSREIFLKFPARFLPFQSSCPPQKRVRKNTMEFIVPSMLDPSPHRQKRRQRRIEHYFLKSQPPINPMPNFEIL
jgi:hypothetical protein